MDTAGRYLPLLARVLLALAFLVAGLGKIPGWEGTAGYMTSKGLPAVSLLLALAIVFEVGGSLSVMLGWKARWGALALIVFTVLATVLFHDFWAMEGQARDLNRIMFLKNLSMIGGLLLVCYWGPGPLSLDERRARR